MVGKNREFMNRVPLKLWYFEGNFTSKIKKYLRESLQYLQYWREILIGFRWKSAFFSKRASSNTNFFSKTNIAIRNRLNWMKLCLHHLISSANPGTLWTSPKCLIVSVKHKQQRPHYTWICSMIIKCLLCPTLGHVYTNVFVVILFSLFLNFSKWAIGL